MRKMRNRASPGLATPPGPHYIAEAVVERPRNAVMTPEHLTSRRPVRLAVFAVLIAVSVAAVLMASPTRAATPAATDARSLQAQALAATCAACHGTGGHAVDAAAVPGLAGLPAGYLAEQMRSFKSGTRPATVMHQIAKGYTDGQIDQLAAWFAAQPK